MNVIKFSKDYPKLEDRVFTTIRRYDRYKIGELVAIRTPKKQFYATILHKFKAVMGDLHAKFLCYDTDTLNDTEAYDVFNSFYRNPVTPFDKMTVLILERFDSQSSSGSVKE